MWLQNAKWCAVKYAWDAHMLGICPPTIPLRRHRKRKKNQTLLAAILAAWFITFLTSTCCFSYGLIRSLLCVSWCNVTSRNTGGSCVKFDLPKINKVRNISRHRLCEVQQQMASAILASWDCITQYFCVLRESDVNLTVYHPKFNKQHTSLCTFPQLSSLFLSLTKPPLSLQHISLLLPLSFTPFLGSADCHCYLPNIVWQRRSGIFCWLKIKVAKSPPQNPPLLLAALKNRGKHQFLTHQWRLHNQLKRHLYRDANLIFVLLELLEDACRDLMLWNKRGSLFLI